MQTPSSVPFYAASTITITEGGWSVNPPDVTGGDILSLEKIGNAYSLTHRYGTHIDGTITDNAHDYHLLTILQPDGTLHITEEHATSQAIHHNVILVDCV